MTCYLKAIAFKDDIAYDVRVWKLFARGHPQISEILELCLACYFAKFGRTRPLRPQTLTIA